MEITVDALQTRGYIVRRDLVRGNVDSASDNGEHILYLIGVAWYVQTHFDYPSVRGTPLTTFEQLAAVLNEPTIW